MQFHRSSKKPPWRSSSAKNGSDEIRLKLYALLVDQLTKYNSIIWQFPTALLAANALIIAKSIGHWLPIALLGVVNIPFAHAFHRLIRAQNALIASAKVAESVLLKEHPDFVPIFPTGGLRATTLMRCLMWLVPCGLLTYSLLIFCSSGANAVSHDATPNQRFEQDASMLRYAPHSGAAQAQRWAESGHSTKL